MIRCLALCLVVTSAALATPPATDTLVITPKRFRKALEPWRQHRAKQGRTIHFIEPGKDLAAQVRESYSMSGKELRFVVIVGDVKQVPCRYVKGVIIAPYERDPRIANDNYLADLDGDKIPELAVGRVPADTPKEAAAMMARVIAYENSRDFSAWRRRVNIVAGVAGFSKFQDTVIEKVTANFLSTMIPADYDLHVTYANANSAFCPPPSRLTPTVLDRFNEGAMVVAYIGHGSRTRLDRMKFRGERLDIFTEDDAYQVDAARGAPIVFFNACLTGHFDGAPDCLSEILLRQKRGPVGIIASSRVSMPYVNAIVAKELLEALFHERCETLGEALLRTKRNLIPEKPNDLSRKQIEFFATIAWQPNKEKRKIERIEHLSLYNLLGDPLLRLPHPARADLECAEEVPAGGRLTINVKSPETGRALVEVIAERTANVPGRKDDSKESFERTYAASNNWVVGSTKLQSRKRTFTAEVKMPNEPGKYFVRVWIEGQSGTAMGSCPVRVVRRTK